ncbi:MAG: alanine--tRNA ligase [Puniceicoccales bacterium]|jgi:alanyl-tRNA synthetase|nr:alanine--tRNA ligase [Puniceicoccales bacterium]
MNSTTVRQSFLDFFAERGHRIVKSSPLMPDSPNLLFTNAGMNQFVPIFLGGAKSPFSRAADTQKCIRAGGKHNDLEDVGFDTYHHTFFEMLGNWSFGDYFKKEAIEMAWELLTKVWKFPKHRLYATIYSPQSGEPASFDGESDGIWRRIFTEEGMDPKVHVVSGAKKDNFWMMGDTGPCGPCTEIHMDLTPSGDGSGNLVNAGSPLCMELWNLVFIEFNANESGAFERLRNRYVDTGIGLERVVGIMAKTKNFSDFSGLPSNYDSDLFADTFMEIENMCGKKYGGTIPRTRSGMSECECTDFWFRAIADHARTLAFAVSDGIFPSNEGRGYVLRRILRRAVMFGNLLKLPSGFFAKLAATVVEKMGAAFPELEEQKAAIEKILQNEEQSFSKTIGRGTVIFNEICNKSTGQIAGSDVFLLYDTYGFPPDLTHLMAMERGMGIDTLGFDAAMEEQRTLARTAQKKSTVEISDDTNGATEFVGYAIGDIADVKATVTGVVRSEGKTFLIFDRTPFYAECGGQVGDRGVASIGEKMFAICGVQSDKNGCYLHEIGGDVDGTIVGQEATLSVDEDIRRSTTRNHSATHLLNAALRQIFGNHVRQAGSFVDGKRLRFDFNALAAPTELELESIEKLVEEKILRCIDSHIFEVSADSIPAGCVANFGEKYGEIVRVVRFGDFSMELCGGCHVKNTSEIACFKIVSCSAIASGIRRIEAVTGQAAFDLLKANCSIVDRQCKNFSCQASEIIARVNALIARCMAFEKSAKAARQTELQGIASSVAASGQPIANGLVRVEANIPNLQPDELRTVALNTLARIGNGVVTLTTEIGGRNSVVTCCSKSAVAVGYHAGNIVKKIASAHGGSGGGRGEFATGGYST